MLVARELKALFDLIWEHEMLPDDWNEAIILPFHKKGSTAECSNYRGISLLCIAYKILESILLSRSREDLEQETRESQAGFRRGRSCADQIFCIRMILESFQEYRQPLVLVFLDFSAAFDSLSRKALWESVRKRLPSKTAKLLETMYLRTRSRVRINGKLTSSFKVNAGVRQGGVMSPNLFCVSIDEVLAALDMTQCGLSIDDGSSLTDLAFADDITLLSSNVEEMQTMINIIQEEALKCGLMLNHSKCKALAQNVNTDMPLKVNGKEIEYVSTFNYLGSFISSNGNITPEVNNRISKATKAFGMLKTLWSSRDVSRSIKLRFYKAGIRSTLLYACETWPLKSSDYARLYAFEKRCLRRILRNEYTSRENVFEECKMKRDTKAEITYRRWKYLGHALRMKPERTPRRCFLMNPAESWKRPQGGVRMTNVRYFKKKCEKYIMNPFNISRKNYDQSWKEHLGSLAQDRNQWRCLASIEDQAQKMDAA